MKAIKAKWRSFVTSGFNLSAGRVGMSRVVLINVISLAGIVVEFVFGLLNLFNAEFLTASVELLIAAAITANVLMLRKHRDVDLAARILMIAVAAPLMLTLLTDRSFHTGLFWMPMFPVAAYLILGKKHGSTALMILFLVIGLLVLLESFELVELAYSFLSIRQMILSLLVLAVLLYVHENLKEQNIKEAEEKTKALSQAYQKIRQSEQLRDEFTTALVHELRNAFVSVQKLTGTWLKQKETVTPERTEKYMKLVLESASDNLALVNNLLDVVNVDTADFKIEKGLYNLRGIVERQVALFRPQAEEVGVQLNYVFDDEVPWQLKIDDFRIKQVMANLLSNAIKHTAPNSEVMIQVIKAYDYDHLVERAEALKLRWYLNKEEKKLQGLKDFVWLGVSHPEEGLKKEDISKLFKKFSRLQPYDKLHPPEGRGLGLYIVRRITESHGGVYGVGSQANKGTTFYVTFPVGRKAPTDK